MSKPELTWQWATFEQLTTRELHEILKLRQAVFVVEQDCAYQDVDDVDYESWHLVGWQASETVKEIVAYLRVARPGVKYPELSIGRVLTARSVRRTNIGRALMREAMARICAEYPVEQSVRISAQKHLAGFYAEFGFEIVSAPYLEDGIPHVEMLRN